MPRLMPPSGGRTDFSGRGRRIAGPGDVVDHGLIDRALGNGILGGVVHVRPVHHERPVVALEHGPRLFLPRRRHVGRRRRRATERADDLGRLVARRRRHGRGRVGAEVGVLDDLSAPGGDQGVDPDHVALVAPALHADPLVLRLGGFDHLLPREIGGRGVDTGGVGHRLAIPQQLGVGPERRGHELVVPEGRRQWGLEDAFGEDLDIRRIGDRKDVAGVGELGDERRVEAHQIDGRIVGCEAPHELLTLLVSLVGQDLGLDAERTVRRLPRTWRPSPPGLRCPG